MNINIEKPSFKQLVLLNMQQLTNFPYIEKDFDAVTDYQLLCKVVEYLNDVITNQNTTNDTVLGLYNAFITLKDYIDNYFENLDVQEEINDKIDSLVEDGTITNLIKSYIDPIQADFEERIDETLTIQNSSIANQNSLINSLESRMDTFTSLTEGSTTGDAELTDIRVAYTGEVYANAGSSVRTQAKNIADNTGVPVYNMSTRNVNQNFYNYGSVISGEEIIFKIQDFTNTPNAFAVYGQKNEGDSSSQFDQLLYTTNINKINEYKENYTKIAINRDYYNIRFFFQYTGTGNSQNVNVIIFKGSDKNLNNRIFALENNFNSLDTIEEETGINIINLTTKNINSNYYDYGMVSKDDTLIYKLIDFTGTPNTFVIYAKVNDDSNWETLVNLNTPELLQDAKDNYKTLTFTKNYNYIRLYMSYNETGLAESSSVLANLLSNDNLLSLSIKNQNDIKSLESNVGNNIYKIFRKVICCGDSYTAGYISVDGQVSQFNENYAWPHFMATSSNNEYKNCGVSGTTCKTWQSNPYGLAKAQSMGTTQAYITGFGINDSNTSIDVYLPVGSVDDIQYDNDTFYSQYAKLVRELHNISPNAYIFMQTCPDNDSARYNPYNEAIRTIANLYHDTYHTHCIDLVEYKDLYNQLSVAGDFIGSHFTAIGYEQFAEILKIAISDYIKNHISEFQKVAFISYSN